MYNLYRGNSGRVRRVEEPKAQPAPPPVAAPPKPPPKMPVKPPPNPLSRLTDLLPAKLGELETEDILLMLILYLMYRESGDSELLMIMGAMFLM